MRWLAKPIALTIALSVASAHFAIAQEHHDDDAHPDAHAQAHPAARPAHPAPAVDKHVVVNEHVNEHVTEHKTVDVQNGHAGPRPIASAGGGRWHSGDRFNGSRAVFTDYDRYHLRRPPPGYAWVQADGELVLINLSTGVITDTFVIAIP